MEPTAQYFASFNAISGFHQVRVDEESSKLLNITTQMGNFRYTVLGQGLCSSQDLFNLITDGTTKIYGEFNVLKNVDNFCIYSDTLEGLEKEIEKCRNCGHIDSFAFICIYVYTCILAYLHTWS